MRQATLDASPAGAPGTLACLHCGAPTAATCRACERPACPRHAVPLAGYLCLDCATGEGTP